MQKALIEIEPVSPTPLVFFEIFEVFSLFNFYRGGIFYTFVCQDVFYSVSIIFMNNKKNKNTNESYDYEYE